MLMSEKVKSGSIGGSPGFGMPRSILALKEAPSLVISSSRPVVFIMVMVKNCPGACFLASRYFCRAPAGSFPLITNWARPSPLLNPGR